MTPILIHLAQALVGGLIIWGLRNTIVEFGWMRRAVWMPLAIFGAGGLVFMDGGTWLQIVLTCALSGILWSMGHGPILQGPGQTIRDDDDVMLRVALLPDKVRNRIGTQLDGYEWVTYATLRYVLPCIVLGFVLQGSWVFIAGALIVLGYWPVAYWIRRKTGWKSEEIGAAIAGAVFYGCL